MESRWHPGRLEEIDQLISDYLDAAASMESETTIGGTLSVEELLEHGAYPPSDPRSRSGAALLAIAGTLQDEGGNVRLADVLEAYRRKYGAKRAAILNARWQYLAE